MAKYERDSWVYFSEHDEYARILSSNGKKYNVKLGSGRELRNVDEKDLRKNK